MKVYLGGLDPSHFRQFARSGTGHAAVAAYHGKVIASYAYYCHANTKGPNSTRFRTGADGLSIIPQSPQAAS